uniref:Uncharacterized protein n=1 Tax=Physcomitrium patens TaxID=3218 RepID=A0A2K1J3K2_PHYPA|nr:hypothetical protein PHYPA_021948 [Physcomitrium patens]
MEEFLKNQNSNKSLKKHNICYSLINPFLYLILRHQSINPSISFDNKFKTLILRNPLQILVLTLALSKKLL